MLRHDESQEHFTKQTKPDVKDYVSYDHIYVKYSCKANVQRQKADLWLCGAMPGDSKWA